MRRPRRRHIHLHVYVFSTGIKYNEEKEEKAKQEAKQKKLAQIEEAKKLAAEKGKVLQPVDQSTQVIKSQTIGWDHNDANVKSTEDKKDGQLCRKA